jgi:hypothetical protein
MALLVICMECRVRGGPKLLEEVEVNVADGLESGGGGTFVFEVGGESSSALTTLRLPLGIDTAASVFETESIR